LSHKQPWLFQAGDRQDHYLAAAGFFPFPICLLPFFRQAFSRFKSVPLLFSVACPFSGDFDAQYLPQLTSHLP
jgi:hypothetical protein